MAQLVKNLPAMQETWVQSLGQEDPLEKEMATHSSILAWKIPWMEQCGSLQSMEFSRPEYWRRYPFPSPGDLPHPGTEPRSPALQADSLPAESQGKPKNTVVSSLSFSSIKSACHAGPRILYQLTYGGPYVDKKSSCYEENHTLF